MVATGFDAGDEVDRGFDVLEGFELVEDLLLFFVVLGLLGLEFHKFVDGFVR